MRMTVRRKRWWLAGVGILVVAVGIAIVLTCTPAAALRHRRRIRKTLTTPIRQPPARIGVVQGVTVVHLYGSHEEMGRQYGRLLAPALCAMIRGAEWVLPEETIAEYLDYARSQEPSLPVEIRRQLRAVADAADVPYDMLVAINVVPQIQCSALAAWGPATADGRLILGRNVDYPDMGLGRATGMIVVYHSRDETPVVCISFLGMLGGFTGINARGVAFANMLVFNVAGPPRRDGGMPIQLAMRLAAHRADDVPSMCEQLAAMRHVIPMNVMIADAREARVLELGLRRVASRSGRSGVLAASNYFLAHPARYEIEPCPRYKSLLAAAERSRGRMTVAEMTAALHQARMEGINLQAAVFEPQAMRMHVSLNRIPASAGPYHVFDVMKLLE